MISFHITVKYNFQKEHAWAQLRILILHLYVSGFHQYSELNHLNKVSDRLMNLVREQSNGYLLSKVSVSISGGLYWKWEKSTTLSSIIYLINRITLGFQFLLILGYNCTFCLYKPVNIQSFLEYPLK